MARWEIPRRCWCLCEVWGVWTSCVIYVFSRSGCGPGLSFHALFDPRSMALSGIPTRSHTRSNQLSSSLGRSISRRDGGRSDLACVDHVWIMCGSCVDVITAILTEADQSASLSNPQMWTSAEAGGASGWTSKSLSFGRFGMQVRGPVRQLN